MLYSGTTLSAGAYGTRLLYSGYTGPVMKIRNGTSNATADFYADATGNLGTAYLGSGTSLATWIGAAVAYVDTWYDQTGNGNHATQTTTTSQPVYNRTSKYVDFGSGQTTGQTAANGSTDKIYFNLPPGTIPYNNASYTVTTKHGTINLANGIALYGLLGVGSTTSNSNNTTNNFSIHTSQNYHNWWYNNDVNTAANTYSANNTISFKYATNGTGAGRAIYVNGTQSTLSGSGTGGGIGTNASPVSPHYMGYNPHSTTLSKYYLNGSLYYMYIVPTALSDADRNVLEATPFA